MSRMSRTVLSAVALTALLAAPVHAAPGSRPVTETLWQWVVGVWQDISLTIDPNGLTEVRRDTRLTIDPNGIRGTIDPNGSSAGTEGSGEGDIRMTIDPNG